MYEVENRIPNFDLYPKKKIDINAKVGILDIIDEINNKIKSIQKDCIVVCFDYYHGVNEMLFEDIAKALQPQLIIHSDIAKYDESMIQNKFGKFITEDRVNGVFSVGNIEEFFDVDKIKDIQNKIQGTKGLVIVYGVASQVVCNPDILISGSISYQTIKDRYNQGLGNWEKT